MLREAVGCLYLACLKSIVERKEEKFVVKKEEKGWSRLEWNVNMRPKHAVQNHIPHTTHHTPQSCIENHHTYAKKEAEAIDAKERES